MPFPYVFPITFDAGYFVEVDWANNSTFVDTYDDLTINTKSIHFSRGKSDELGKSEVGQLSITINNTDGLYTPSNPAGSLYLSLLPKRTIKVYYSARGTNYPLFYGFIEEIIPHPHPSEQDCIITAVDGGDFLSRHDLETSLLKSVATGSVVNTILDNSDWSSSLRSIDTGIDTVKYWYGHDKSARTALGEIEDSELGLVYINGAGNLVYEDRHHRWGVEHQTSQFTFNDTMEQINYSMNPKNIYNTIKSTITPWSLSASSEELWRLQEVPSLDIGETKTFWGNSNYFVDAWDTIVASTDYLANSASTGLGDNETANLSVSQSGFAQAIRIDTTNNTDHMIYLTLLKAKGKYYDGQTTITIKKEDVTSQTNYQKRTLDRAGKYQDSTDVADGYCNIALAKYKDPRPEISITVVNSSSTLLYQQLSREISDRITILNTKLGLNSDFFIEAMEHTITDSGLYHRTTYRVSDAINDDFWVLDYSALASASTTGQTKLGY